MIVNLKTLCRLSLSEFGKVVWLARMDALFKNSPEHDQIMNNINDSFKVEVNIS